jgi:hypothetical protein
MRVLDQFVLQNMIVLAEVQSWYLRGLALRGKRHLKLNLDSEEKPIVLVNICKKHIQMLHL